MVLIIVQLYPHGGGKRFGTAHLFFQDSGTEAVPGLLIPDDSVNDCEECKEDDQRYSTR